jgi:nucleotide-binding universal stress UspA family protein
VKAHTIVVGFDGSQRAHDALEAAASLVAADGIVHVVTAFHPAAHARAADTRVSPAARSDPSTPPQVPEEFHYVVDPEADYAPVLLEATRLLDGRDIAHEGHLVADDPAAAILDVAERVGADLIVVGSRGLGGLGRFVRGSVSTRVATHAPNGVLVVHQPIAV